MRVKIHKDGLVGLDGTRPNGWGWFAKNAIMSAVQDKVDDLGGKKYHTFIIRPKVNTDTNQVSLIINGNKLAYYDTWKLKVDCIYMKCRDKLIISSVKRA